MGRVLQQKHLVRLDEELFRVAIVRFVHAKELYNLPHHFAAHIQQHQVRELGVLDISGGAPALFWHLKQARRAEVVAHVRQDLRSRQEEGRRLARDGINIEAVRLQPRETLVARTIRMRCPLVVPQALAPMQVRHAQRQQMLRCMRAMGAQVKRQLVFRSTDKHVPQDVRTVAAPKSKARVLIRTVSRDIQVTILTPCFCRDGSAGCRQASIIGGPGV